MNPSSTKDCKNGELASYQDAVWSYLLEHCDLTKDGALFVKFHTDDRATFERRINARWKSGYHRGDPVAKNETHLEKRFEHERGRNGRLKKDICGIAFADGRFSLETCPQQHEVFLLKRGRWSASVLGRLSSTPRVRACIL